jgi:hypothetical protein
MNKHELYPAKNAQIRTGVPSHSVGKKKHIVSGAADEMKCLPSFNSLNIENQLYNTKSETDRVR